MFVRHPFVFSCNLKTKPHKLFLSDSSGSRHAAPSVVVVDGGGWLATVSVKRVELYGTYSVLYSSTVSLVVGTRVLELMGPATGGPFWVFPGRSGFSQDVLGKPRTF